jgi:zinc transport system substrate-binding protein
MAKTLARAALVAAFLSPTAAALAGPPSVVASFQPLQSLAALVMQGVGTPETIVTSTVSEHTYALKPSDARKLKAADLVILIGPEYESFLTKPLKDRKGETLAILDVPGLKRLPVRQGGAWEAHEHHDDHHDHETEDEHGADDGHVWLDPTNAALAIQAIADRLATMDPVNGGLYQSNAQAARQRVDALDKDLAAMLAPVKDRPFVVFHDAYQYFESRYGLAGAGSITVDPDRPPSAKRVAALRDRLKAAKTACVFREPQFPSPLVVSLAESTGAREGVLDPQGAAIPNGPDHYFTLMRQLGQSLLSCLTPR